MADTALYWHLYADIQSCPGLCTCENSVRTDDDRDRDAWMHDMSTTVEAVLDLHQSHSYTDTSLWCAHDGQPYPCETVRTIAHELGVGIEQTDTLRGERP